MHQPKIHAPWNLLFTAFLVEFLLGFLKVLSYLHLTDKQLSSLLGSVEGNTLDATVLGSLLGPVLVYIPPSVASCAKAS